MQAHTIGVQSPAGLELASRSDRLVAAAVAAVLGLFVLWGVGFSQIPALHNAAHDTRHSVPFPCH